MAQVTFDSVSKTFPGGGRADGVQAVKSFSLDVHDGEFLVLVGPSGCGKTTVLRMLAGLEDATSGTIAIGGRIVNNVAPKDRDIAMVFQNYALYPHMTVYKNMGFALKMRGVPKPEIDRRVRETAKTLGIGELLDRKPRELSGGQRQRVAVGRAIVREPKAFLFDEPLSNLDAKLRVTTRAELKSLHQRLKTTSVYVTHDQEEAMTLGDRIVVMSKGTIQQADSPLNVYRRPANRFVAGFVGTPPMNFFEGKLVLVAGGVLFDEGSTDPDGRAYRLKVSPKHTDALTAHAGKPIVLGLRPQALREATPVTAGESAADWRTWKLPVRVVEPLGDSMDVFASTPRHQLVARVPAHSGLAGGAGGTAILTPNMDEAHWFEVGEFGKNLLL
jgi:multiple sugar transport system ATP-binding protein